MDKLKPPRFTFNRRYLIIVVIAVLAVSASGLLNACSTDINLLDETKLYDTSLLTGEPCEAPCWNDISPGETSYRDAKLIIESDARFQIAEEFEPQEDNPQRGFTFAEGENAPCCQVVSSDGETISSMQLLLAPKFAFGPVMDRYGEPGYAAAAKQTDEQGYMLLIYPNVPMIVFAFVANPNEGALSVNSEIIGVTHIEAAEMHRLLLCASLHEWRGFVDFSSYASEEFDYIGEGVGDEEACPSPSQ